MKSLMTILFIAMCGVTLAQQKEFGWIVGTWKLKNKNIFETWSVSNDGQTLQGNSFIVNGQDTVVTEMIQIQSKSESFFYIPLVRENQGPVDFKITRYSANSFVAENPNHDFPKVIRYTFIRREDGDCIDASIEGNGKVIPYSFTRIK